MSKILMSYSTTSHALYISVHIKDSHEVLLPAASFDLICIS